MLPPVPKTEATARLRFYADRGRAHRGLIAFAALLLAPIVAVAAALLLTPAKKVPTGPLSRADVLSAAHGFASAYGSRNPRALVALLAPNVIRVTTTATEHGRAAVLAEYEHQFKANPIRAYELQDPVVRAGDVGRVAARYTVRLSGGGTITGTVVFGVERLDGRPAIGLIATQQTG